MAYNTRPSGRPAMLRKTAVDFLAADGVTTFPALLGRRGFNRDSMGKLGNNDIGIFDDAIFLVTDQNIYSWNANVDPSIHRDGIATLKAGSYTYKLGTHHPGTPKAYPCLVQAGDVTVTRWNQPGEFTGEFYIHIHRGGENTTSSEGCQTIWAEQWDDFFTAVKAVMGKTIPYVLTDRDDA